MALPEENNIIANEKVKRGSRKAQYLKEANLTTIDGQTLGGLSQEIDTSKLGLKTNQKIYCLNSPENSNTLFTVSSQGNPVASFSSEQEMIDGQAKDVTKFKISKEQWDKLLALNPAFANFPKGVEQNGYYTYDINKLVLTEGLSGDVQIRVGNETFAVRFAAGGMEIIDKDGNRATLKNDEISFDIGITDKGLNDALNKRNGLEIKNEGVAYDSLLICEIQKARANAKEANKDKIISLEFPNDKNKDGKGDKLYSIPKPMIGDDGQLYYEYIYFLRRDEKLYMYCQTTNEANPNSKNVPALREVDLAQLEKGKQGYSVYIGVKGNNQVLRTNWPINKDIDANVNAKFIEDLRSIMPKEWEKTHTSNGNEVKPLSRKLDLNGRKYNLYNTPNEAYATVVTTDGIAVLSKVAENNDIEKEPEQKTPNNGNGENGGGDEKPHFIDPSPTPNPTPTPEPSPNPNPEVEKPKDDKPKEESEPVDDKIPWKDVKTPKKKSWKNTFIGLFALATLLSVLVPWLGIAAGILLGAVVFTDVKPWLVQQINDAKKNAKAKETKEEKKQREREQSRDKYKSKINKNKQKLTKFQKEKIEINSDTTLSSEEKRQKIDKLNEKIAKLDKQIKDDQYNLNSLEIGFKIEDQKDVITEKKAKYVEDKKVLEQNLKDLKGDIAEVEKRRDELVSTRDKEKQELDQLEEKKDSDLSEEEKKRRNMLRAKYNSKKNNNNYTAIVDNLDYTIEGFDLETEIANCDKQIDAWYNNAGDKLKASIKDNEDKLSALEEQHTQEIKTEYETLSDLQKQQSDLDEKYESSKNNDAQLESYNPENLIVPDEEKGAMKEQLENVDKQQENRQEIFKAKKNADKARDDSRGK